MSEEDAFELASRSSECSETEKPKNQTEDEKDISKCKIIVSHCLPLVVAILFKFTYGLNIGFTTNIIPELYKADAEIKMTLGELTWFSSYCFAPPIGAILGGFLTQFFGCRIIFIISGISYVISGLIFHWSTSAAMLLFTQAIVGFIDGLLKAPCLTFLAEISLPRLRNTTLTLIGLGMFIGIFTGTTLGTYIHWRTLALVNMIYPTAGVIIMCFVPESPYWLASKNRYEDAKRSLAWFRGWTTPESVEIEMHSMLSTAERISKNAEKKNSTSNLTRTGRLKQMAKPYLNRSFYIPFLTVTVAFVAKNCSGTWPMNTFSVLVFEKINSPLDAHVGAIIFSALRVVGSVSDLLLVSLVDKRKILFVTVPTSAVALTAAAVFGFLTTNGQLTSDVCRWIPTISIFTSVFFTTTGIDKISTTLNSEIFPLHLRHMGAGAGNFVNMMSMLSVNKIFLYLADAITIWGTFIFFILADVIGLIGIYFLVPVTKDKSLHEIEEHFAGTKSLFKSKLPSRQKRRIRT